MLLGAGHWIPNYWPSNYWDINYWPHYPVVTIGTKDLTIAVNTPNRLIVKADTGLEMVSVTQKLLMDSSTIARELISSTIRRMVDKS